MKIKWIKIATDFYKNRKIIQIKKLKKGDTLCLIWLEILALTGELNSKGELIICENIPYNSESLATELGRKKADIESALKIFEEFKMIEIVENTIHIIGWCEYQNVDAHEKLKKEQNRERQKRHREKQKNNCDESVTDTVTESVTHNADVTQCNATEEERRKKKEEEELIDDYYIKALSLKENRQLFDIALAGVPPDSIGRSIIAGKRVQEAYVKSKHYEVTDLFAWMRTCLMNGGAG